MNADRLKGGKIMKELIKRDWLPILILIVNLIVGIVAFQVLPQQVPGHFNINGQIDSYISKSSNFLLTTIMPLGMYLLMLALPYIDPKKANYRKFEKPYSIIKAIIILVFFAINLLVTAIALGFALNIPVILCILIGLMYVLLGNYISVVKQNFFVGIRTPWTLSDPENWSKTHRVGGKTFVVSGILCMLFGFLYPVVSFIILMLGAFIPVIYSFAIFIRAKKA